MEPDFHTRVFNEKIKERGLISPLNSSAENDKGRYVTRCYTVGCETTTFQNFSLQETRMKFFAVIALMLVCSVSYGQTPTIDPIDVPLPIYVGPGFDPTPDLGIQPWPTPTGNPNYAPDCCERLARLDWMRNEYDILEEKLYDEIDILDIYLAQAPLDPEEAQIVLSIMIRIMYFERALEEYGAQVRLQAQIYAVVCVDCENCQP